MGSIKCQEAGNAILTLQAKRLLGDSPVVSGSQPFSLRDPKMVQKKFCDPNLILNGCSRPQATPGLFF